MDNIYSLAKFAVFQSFCITHGKLTAQSGCPNPGKHWTLIRIKCVYKDPLKFNEFEFKNLINYFSARTRGLLEQDFAFCCFYGINLCKKLCTAAGHLHFYQELDSRAIHFFHLIERMAGSFFHEILLFHRPCLLVNIARSLMICESVSVR